MHMSEAKFDMDINRELYDSADDHTPKYVAKPGINEEIVRLISKTKNEPEWMLNKRLEGLKLFRKTPTPTWGPDLSKLDVNNIIFFVDPNTNETDKWDDVPEEIKKTFDKLGIPEAERKSLSAVWSGGTFIYVPKGVKVDLPLQAYFIMNYQQVGQFEHTLIIVDEGAELH